MSMIVTGATSLRRAEPPLHEASKMIAQPSVLTKELKLQANESSGERWLRCSSNFLRSFGFKPGTRISRNIIGNGQRGLRFSVDPLGDASVYERAYRRRNNAREAQLDVKSRSLIDAAFPTVAERVHFTFRPAEILAVPVPNHTFHIRKAIKSHQGPFHAFLAMSSGIDGIALARVGFKTTGLLEFRPQETRDSSDLTETGVLTAMANLPDLDVVFNENVMTIDWKRVEETMKGRPTIGCLHMSLQCDDFSTLKGTTARLRGVANLSTSMDMVFDGLRMVEVLRPATVLVEQVPGFAEKMGTLMEVRLRRWGYNVQSAILSAPDFRGLTGRTRYYLVASVFPHFQFPAGLPRRTKPVWESISDQLGHCRDVTENKTVKDGQISPRGWCPLTSSSLVAPTLVKSQSHMPKDALYLKADDGRYLAPNVEILRRLNGIPPEFDFSEVSQTIAIEQIGQSIDFPMHHAIVQAVHDHLRVNAGESPRKISPAQPDHNP